jgi:hypothetical protein
MLRFLCGLFWASRFAPFGCLRRAIRSITFAATRLRWFRCYPSRCAAFGSELEIIIFFIADGRRCMQHLYILFDMNVQDRDAINRVSTSMVILFLHII